ncbi:MAG TPA: hypothetical protein VN040_04340 [Pseudosphingobacterium sp.]|nr:hypothetical protein [Pseudosphingobacterium sp.]
METKNITKNRIWLKTEMLRACIKKHQSVIDDFKTGIKELLDTEKVDDPEDAKLNDATVLEINQLVEQLRFANEEMETLNGLSAVGGSKHDYVKLGSVVVTDKDIFFVSASVERFEVAGLSVFGLSVKSPLFKAMEGLKVRDNFTYGTRNYHIIDLF